MKFISGLLGGSLRKFRAIHGRTVAAAMLSAAKKESAGTFTYTYDDIRQLAAAT